jgi:hypothetical protein
MTTPASTRHESIARRTQVADDPLGAWRAPATKPSADCEPNEEQVEVLNAPSVLSSAPTGTSEPADLSTMPDACSPRKSSEQARQDLREASEWITRAGEHPSDSDISQIIVRLQRAAHAGDVEAQTRFGNYVVGYYLTDEMFWPKQRAVAIAALAMLRVAARKVAPDPNNSLMVALARDKVDFSKANDVPALPRAWVDAALAEAKRWEKCTPSEMHPNESARGATPCPALGGRSLSSSAVDRRLAGVKRGWTAKRVLHVAGKPTACHENKWYYIGGQWSGPEVTYTLTFENGVVSNIEQAGVACRI